MRNWRIIFELLWCLLFVHFYMVLTLVLWFMSDHCK